MHSLKIIKASLILFLLFINAIYAESKIEHKIAVIVNEELITSYDIIQRMKLSAILQGININENNNQLLINNTVDELIHEKLKKEKIKEYEITFTEKEYLEFETNFLLRLNFDKTSLKNLLITNNINFVELENLLANELSWNNLINALYVRLTSVSDMEVDEIISKNPNISIEQAKNLVIQRQLDLKSSKLMRDMINEATIDYK
tara:strand:- start:70 stop:681 length:612 start_codon:yes stop_codon:yes gene_type:complete